eukprot:98483_1
MANSTRQEYICCIYVVCTENKHRLLFINESNKTAILKELNDKKQNFPIHYQIVTGSNHTNTPIQTSNNNDIYLKKIIINAHSEKSITSYVPFEICPNCTQLTQNLQNELAHQLHLQQLNISLIASSLNAAQTKAEQITNEMESLNSQNYGLEQIFLISNYHRHKAQKQDEYRPITIKNDI